ncbi:hypothetical protein FEM48_Zijuj12G0152900 [Ziziphus jujuba var. spinosa]|uniref:Uncharacterized protein n=1 Tax=Ziziphus jujuba var. spinosa TaxID=714518 RepID=A0A978UE35_ZIZJJ|nr:hypothetical protein FEM48_Zijuj12G0152900 [Ziziphus jujuba var. spinosa]
MASPSKPKKTKEQRQKDSQEALNTIDKDGDSIKYVNHHNWRGIMFNDTMPKPHTEVKNGEWHSFVHVGVRKAGYTHIDPVSVGSTLYRVQMDTGKFCDVFFAWDTNDYRGQVNQSQTASMCHRDP